MKLDHLGIAVRSIETATKFYQDALGVRVAGIETIPREKVKVAMLPLGSTRIELLEATAEDSTIARFIAKRGEGLHHIAIEVEDLEAHMRKMQAAGVRLVKDEIQVGAGGHRYVFVHPASAGGVLIELVESRGGKSQP